MNQLPYDYAEFQRRARLATQHRRRLRRFLAATACCATLFVAAGAWMSRMPGDTLPFATGQAEPAPAVAATALPGAAPPLLTEPPADPVIVRVGTGMVASRIEDRIAVLDEQLNDAQFGGDTLSHIHSLRSERMQLLDSLVRVRYAERLASAVR